MESKSEISIEDFSKVELRVGTIKEAFEVEGSEKLVKLLISEGDAKRQILAGIKKSYTPENLIGRQILYVSNLKPRVLAGHESQGMVLVAHDSNGFTLLSPASAVADGSDVS